MTSYLTFYILFSPETAPKKILRNIAFVVLMALVLTPISWAGENIAEGEAANPSIEQAALSQKAVRTGLDVLIAKNFQPLAGKRVGLITNPTGIASNGDSTVQVFQKAGNFKLVALFGPEHGVYGDQIAGGYVPSIRDPRTGLQAFSLYSKTRKPTPEMLKGIDVLVYDIQDIGVRSYTYISTMGLAMEAAGEAGIEFMVLDRPNPLGGERVEGPGVDPGYVSFVSQWPVPYVYGMTCGELAQMLIGEKWIKKAPKLTVIPMEGWKRSMPWEETGLRWVPTSPHIPTAETAIYYAITGWMGELLVISNGVGYPQPFVLVGAPEVKADTFAKAMNAFQLEGLWFRPAYYKSFYTNFKDVICGGVQIYCNTLKNTHLTGAGIYLLEELMRETGRNFFAEAKKEQVSMFDSSSGSDRIRKAVLAKTPAQEIVASWKNFEETFKTKRQPYLLYP